MKRGAWTCCRPLMVAGVTAFAVTLLCLQLPWWCSLLLAAASVVAAVFLCRRPNAVFVLLCGALFLISGGCHIWRQVEPVTAAAGQEDCLVGDVLECSGNWYTVAVAESAYLPMGSRVLLYASDLAAPSFGDRIQATVILQDLSPYQTYRRADGIYLAARATGYDENSVQVLSNTRPDGLLTGWRQWLIRRLTAYLPGDEGALLKAMCLGDASYLSDEVSTAFRASGLSHLLVVSGLHVTMVSGSVLGLLMLCRVRRRVAVVLAMAVTVLFMLFIGLTPSVSRAGVMCLVMMGGSLLRRPADPLNSMGLALLLLLAYTPYMAVDGGLLLSFTATGGVVVLTPRLYRWLTAFCEDGASGYIGVAVGFWKTMAGILAASVGALLPLMPLLVGMFGRLCYSAPLANLLAVIPAGWSLLVGWVALLLLAVPLPLCVWLGEGALFVAAMPARWLLRISCLLRSEWSLPYVWHRVLLTALCVGLIFCVRRPKYVGRRVLATFLVLMVAAGGLGLGMERNVVNLWVCPNEDGTALLLKQDNHAALLVTHSEALYQGSLAVMDAGVTALETVVVGESHSTNAGQLARLFRECETATVYTTTATNWTAGLSRDLAYMSPGATIVLWEGATLALQENTRWVLRVDGCELILDFDDDRLTATGQGVDLLVVAASPKYRLTARRGEGWHIL